nr:hypothetical protein [Allomuricauda sp.]
MKKEITIRPENNDISLLATALKHKNSFLIRGFKTLSAFSSIMKFHMPKYASESELKKLDAWWRMRLKDQQINADTEYVLEQLKHE